MSEAPLIIHASCVAVNGAGLLILGPSGAGKSGLALQLMAFGAALVADDRTLLRRAGADIIADAPPQIAGRIEARGIGILNATPYGPVRLRAIVDLAQPEGERLPPLRTMALLDKEIPLIYKGEGPYFAAALMQYLKGDRSA
ncbi:MAG: HPr kinase/phosphatase C-terminal domain-containing protein [Paracoccaceae bacterium]